MSVMVLWDYETNSFEAYDGQFAKRWKMPSIHYKVILSAKMESKFGLTWELYQLLLLGRSAAALRTNSKSMLWSW